MKKLSLELLRLTSDEVLERSQMKKITGGYGGNCTICYLYDNSNPRNVIQTLTSAGHCDAGTICFNLKPLCHTWSCH